MEKGPFPGWGASGTSLGFCEPRGDTQQPGFGGLAEELEMASAVRCGRGPGLGGRSSPTVSPSPGPGCMVRQTVNLALGVLVTWLSIPVVFNLLSPKQVMNSSFNPLRIVNTYGAFGRYLT